MRAGSRTFLVVTLPEERITIVFEYKPARGARPGAYVSCRTTPPMDPERAVSGMLLGRPEPDPLAVADLEIARYRRAWGATKREMERLIAQQRTAKANKNPRKRVLRAKNESRKGG